MIQGIIFDADGTLLDSLGVWDGIPAGYLRSIGYEPREDLREVFQALSLQQAAEYYRAEYGVTKTVEEIVCGINHMLEEAYFHHIALKPGVADFLGQLTERGLKMCVATATDRHLVEAALKRCGTADCFSALFTCGELGRGKDEPAIYQAACKHLGTSVEKTLVFEDAPYALETARRAGFPTVGIFDGFQSNQEAVEQRSNYYLRDFEDWNSFWEFASAL